MITLNAVERKGQLKSELNTLRRDGYIPYVVYSKNGTSQIGAIVGHEFEAVLRNLRQGFLPTMQFVLKDGAGRSRTVLIKDIQYKPTTYQVIHIDFLELADDNKVRVKIPVELLNIVDCVGVKMGGFLRQSLRHIEVSCLPKNMPSHFSIDVKELDILQGKKVKDIAMPQGVSCLVKGEDIVVSIVKK